jgi:hypothetical protein
MSNKPWRIVHEGASCYIYVNGQDIAPYVLEYHLEGHGGQPPCLILFVDANMIEAIGPALGEIKVQVAP